MSSFLFSIAIPPGDFLDIDFSYSPPIIQILSLFCYPLSKMAPSKPALRPLKTSKQMTFPSELYYNSPATSDSDTIKKEEGSSTSLSPPSSYTEFLKALTPVFSPASTGGTTFPRQTSTGPGSHPSPISIPSSTTSSTFPAADELSKQNKTGSPSVPPPSPAPTSVPLSAKPPTLGPVARLRQPPPYTAYSPSPSPVMDSPRTATVIRSPHSPPEWRIRYVESPKSANKSSFTVQHVVTTTITFKRSPPVGPPPKGKRKRTTESEKK